MGRFRIIWLTALLVSAMLTGCGQRRQLESIAGESASVAEEAANSDVENATGPSGLTEQEILGLVSGLLERGEEVFWWYMGDGVGLDVEETADYSIVVRKVGRFDTIAELQEATEQVFSRRFCQEILYPTGFNENQGNNMKFQEIDGQLYINQNNGGMGWPYALTDRIEVQSEQPDRIVLRVVSEELSPVSDGVEEVPFDFELVCEDGGWKLDSWYQYGTDELPTLREEGDGEISSSHTYDAGTETLTLPDMGVICTVPSALMEQVELVGEEFSLSSARDPQEETTIERVTFYYRGASGAYRMFSLTRWVAAEWDIPKEYGPLPDECARSADGKWVIVHASAALAAENPLDSGERAAMWELIDAYERPIVQSVQPLS